MQELAQALQALAPSGTFIREGLAEVVVGSQKRKDGRDDVFYNPAQVFNRDLSVLALSVFARIRRAEIEERIRKRGEKAKESGKPVYTGPEPGLHVLEALAATGIRSIRYAKELGEGPHGVRCIMANDLDSAAVAKIRHNLSLNGIREGLIEVNCGDAASFMYARKARGTGGLGDCAYDVIDIDPYGTCSPFVDSAVQAVADGGLLCVTSTDMPVLGGNHPETCFARYGGAALKSGYVHEMALRLVMYALCMSAAKYGREVQPMMCCSIDFYVRLFVRVFDSPARVKQQASKSGLVHQCVQCESFFIQPFGDIGSETGANKFKPAKVVVPGSECPECGGRLKVGGPCYIGIMHDEDFVQKCLDVCTSSTESLPGVTSWKKIRGLLTAIDEEHADLPLFYRLPQLCKGLKLQPVPLRQFRGTLLALGYRVSHMHRDPEAIKTDAPNSVVYDLMRLWAEENPPKANPLPLVLKKELGLKRPFEWETEPEDQVKKKKVPKFLPNPEPNWGPKPRARGGGSAEEPAPKADATVKDEGASGVAPP